MNQGVWGNASGGFYIRSHATTEFDGIISEHSLCINYLYSIN